MPEFTDKQGRYLAFIYHYTKINQRPPAVADIQHFFRVSPPSAQDMVIRLEKKGFISRVPGQARTIKVLVPFEELPPLE